MIPPRPATLKKYGLSEKEWIDLYNLQDGKCPCGKHLGNRICVDHEHIKGWKNLSPEIRKKYVRGLTDWRCNYHFLGKGMTPEIADGLALYLRKYEARKPK